jgi:formylglycine-generating enzyme required for sulfatase activity/energy-coupling factor transporter ATP-binding protein EcfA2
MFVSLEAVAKARSGVSEEPYLNQKELSLIPLDFSALSPASDETTRDSKDQRATVLAEMALSISPTVIITGGPGSGKTTVLQYIAFVLAESLLSGDSSVATTKLGVVGEMPIPVAAPLNAYAKHLSTRAGSGDPRDSTLLRFLEEYLILRQANLGLPSEFFSRLLHEGRPCVFLLDGLDEIADEAERVQVSRAIQDLAQSPFRSSIITTSRTRAYRGDAVLPPEFEELKLRALGTTAVHGLIEAFCTAFYRDPDERLRNLRSLVQSIEALEQGRRFAKSTIGPLISSPLMVRMVITLHLSGRSIPDQRAELYQNYIDALILATYHPDVVVANRLSTAGGSLYTQRSLLARIAFEMHKRGEHERPALSERELTSVVYRHLALSVTSHEAQESTGRFLEATRQRGGVLEESAGMYQFNHPALEEFLTGRYLAETLRHPEKISAFLEEDRRIARSWWHEPAVLCIGYVSSTSPDTAHELLQYLIDFHQSDDVLALAQLEAVGEACVEWQVGSSVRDQLATKLTEILFGATTHGIPADLRVAAGRILGLLGDKRLDVDAKVPQVARIPEGKFSMGHGMDQERVNLPSFQSGAYGMEVKEFAIGLYPVTNYQFREFISAGGYTAASRDCWTKTGWDWRVVMDIGSPAYWEDPTWTIDNHPVVGVSWFEAIAYCRWLSQTTARRISLPTEVEWEKAAKGAEVRAWPWGAKFVPEQANTAEGGIGQTVCVGLFPGNESPFGVRDCAGNVWNWCSSQFRGFGQYDPSDGREELEGSSPRCIRGGSWLNAKDFARCANRDHYFPGDRHFDLGFRIKEILS